MKNSKFIDYINIVCDMLDIENPVVHWKDTLHTPTQKAEYQPDTDALLIAEQDGELDTLFAVTHELRHKWQFENRKDMFDNYKNSAELSITEYNLQSAEVDANAYAVYAMSGIIGIRPTFDDLGKEVVRAIEKRVAEIEIENMELES